MGLVSSYIYCLEDVEGVEAEQEEEELLVVGRRPTAGGCDWSWKEGPRASETLIPTMCSLLALLVKGAWALCACPVGMSVILLKRVKVGLCGRSFRAKELQEVDPILMRPGRLEVRRARTIRRVSPTSLQPIHPIFPRLYPLPTLQKFIP